MLAPAGRRDLVLDQRIDGVVIRNAQQRFGEAHEGNTLVAGKAIFREEHLHQARIGPLSDRLDQRGRSGNDFFRAYRRRSPPIRMRLQLLGLRRARRRRACGCGSR